MGELKLDGNENLNNLDGLSNLESVIQNIRIKNNNAITNLNGLQNLLLIGEDLYIENNSLLTNFCSLQQMLLGNGLAGNYNVSNNAYNPTKQDIIDGNCSL